MSENVRVVVPASDPAAHTLDMAHVLVDEPDPLRRDMRWSEVVTSFRNTEVSRPASEGHKRFQETWFMRQALPLPRAGRGACVATLSDMIRISKSPS
jgi:hypothetical protein